QQRAERAVQHVGILILTVVPMQWRREGARRHRMMDDGEAPVGVESVDLPVDTEAAQVEMVACPGRDDQGTGQGGGSPSGVCAGSASTGQGVLHESSSLMGAHYRSPIGTVRGNPRQ